jgi:hypothetical protein
MHSRAAYGYAMAAGHLSSLLNFALLQTVRLPWLPSDPCDIPCQESTANSLRSLPKDRCSRRFRRKCRVYGRDTQQDVDESLHISHPACS